MRWVKDEEEEERTVGEEGLTLSTHRLTVLKAQVTGRPNNEEMSHSKVPVKYWESEQPRDSKSLGMTDSSIALST